MTSVGAAERMSQAADGLLRFDVRRDLAAVIDLLELGFGDELEERDRRWLKDLAALSAAGPLMNVALRLIPGARDGLGGFVWYDSGRLIGNVSLLRSGPDTWVIANVVTHPAFRRRGICGHLMNSALDAARHRAARRVQLQVRDTNAGAKALYARLGFRAVGATALLRLPAQRAERFSVPADLASAAAGPTISTPFEPAVPSRITVVPWRRAGEGRVSRLLARAGELGRPGPPSLVRQTARRSSLKGRLDDWLHSRTRHRLAAMVDGDCRALAVVDAYSHGGPHRIDAAIDPAWRGRLETILVAACLQKLTGEPSYDVEADVPGADGPLRAALEGTGFTPVRTLERMELWLGDLTG